MSTSWFRTAMGVAACVLIPVSLVAQRPALVIGVDAGGAYHLTNLNDVDPSADFDNGFTVGGSVGIDVNRYFGVHADFSFTRNTARGAAPFAGTDCDRYFYGVHFEARYPFRWGLGPYAFLGGGAVTVDQNDAPMVPVFTKPALMYGVGVGYTLPGTSFGLFAEAKNLVYRWDRGTFDRTQVDLTYAGGIKYSIGF